ncbi:MAG TPA: hypothetical protein VMW89_01430, partial [Desulfatiglandales bacterium]|nr:hypothetical protein [Desulfatiglandales bacterium]
MIRRLSQDPKKTKGPAQIVKQGLNPYFMVEPHAQARGTSTFFGGTRRSISAFVPIGLRRITLPSIHPRASPWLSA